MLTGSLASSYYGEPRATHDVDLVVELQRQEVPALQSIFPEPEFYLDPQSVHDAISRASMVNVLHVDSGDKLDLWMLTDHPFDQSRFARRVSATVAGIDVDLSTPEDTILQKLKWAEESGGSEKQFTDALRIYEVQAARLETAYLEHWALRLGVQDLWIELKARARPL
jgi:hypothetical protein